jgi:hypothetical protein
MADTLAFGLILRLKETAAGGRRSAIRTTPGERMAYRPNWGLPSMQQPEQTGAPVFAFNRQIIEPGSEPVRAVIVVPYPQTLAMWDAEVHPGATLPMYEGPHVVGSGTVLWRQPASLPLEPPEIAAFETWLAGEQISPEVGPTA